VDVFQAFDGDFTANVREFGRIEGLAVEDWTFRS
jgi:hypothetical protein